MVKKQQSVLYGRGGHLVFCALHHDFVFVLRQNYEKVLSVCLILSGPQSDFACYYSMRLSLCSTGEHQGLAGSDKPAPKCQWSLFSFSSLSTMPNLKLKHKKKIFSKEL